MVNKLITMMIKVNVPASAELFLLVRGHDMKKTKGTRGIWTWLLGGGWAGGGGGGG
jgi:hypothetical protein